MNADARGWLRRLARPGARLAPRKGGRSGYGVYANADRRRRPLATGRAPDPL